MSANRTDSPGEERDSSNTRSQNPIIAGQQIIDNRVATPAGKLGLTACILLRYGRILGSRSYGFFCSVTVDEWSARPPPSGQGRLSGTPSLRHERARLDGKGPWSMSLGSLMDGPEPDRDPRVPPAACRQFGAVIAARGPSSINKRDQLPVPRDLAEVVAEQLTDPCAVSPLRTTPENRRATQCRRGRWRSKRRIAFG